MFVATVKPTELNFFNLDTKVFRKGRQHIFYSYFKNEIFPFTPIIVISARSLVLVISGFIYY